MNENYQRIIGNVQKMVAQKAPDTDITSYLQHEGLSPRQFETLLEGPTVMGSAKELFKGIVPGAVGLAETAGTGFASMLPDSAEKAVRSKVKEFATAAKKPFEAAPGYEDSVTRKLGEGVGSTLPFFAAGPLGLAGRIGAGALGVAAGAGEAREAAEAKGATEEERRDATLLGAPTGLLDIIAPEIKAFKSLLVTAAARGGVEGVTEAAQKVAQNLIAKGVYDPSQEILVGSGEEGAYGAGVGALASLIVDMTVGRKARRAHLGLDKEPPAAPAIAPAAPAGPATPRVMTYAERMQELTGLSSDTLDKNGGLLPRKDLSKEEKARFYELSNMNQQESVSQQAEPLTWNGRVIKAQANEPLQGEFRETVGLPVGEAPTEELPEAEAEFPTLLTGEVLAKTGLSKSSGFFKQLQGLDMANPEDQPKIAAILAKVRANKNLSPGTKDAIESLAMTAFGGLSQQSSFDLGPTITTLTDQIITDNVGLHPTNKKVRGLLLNKDITDPAQAAEVKEILTDYANGPKTGAKQREAVGKFLERPEFAADTTPTAQEVVQPETINAEQPGSTGEPTVGAATELYQAKYENLPNSDNATHVFATAKGSVYEQRADGTTVRDKQQRPEHVGEKEKGLQPASLRTIFVQNPIVIAPVNTPTVLRPTTEGKVARFFSEDYGPRKAGSMVPGTETSFTSTPEVGLYPVEIFPKGSIHFGNAITEVKPVGAKATALTPTEEENIARATQARHETMLDGLVGDLVAAPDNTRVLARLKRLSLEDQNYVLMAKQYFESTDTSAEEAKSEVGRAAFLKAMNDKQYAIRKLAAQNENADKQAEIDALSAFVKNKIAQNKLSEEAVSPFGISNATALRSLARGKSKSTQSEPAAVEPSAKKTSAKPRGDGLQKSVVKEAVDLITQKWVNAPSISVVQSVEELPQELLDGVAPERIAQVKGGYDAATDTVFVVADNVVDYRDLVTTVTANRNDSLKKAKLRRAKSGEPGSRKSIVEGWVAKVIKNWVNVPPIEVVQDVNGLPVRIQEQFARDNITNAKGLFDPMTGVVYVIADNVSSATDLLVTVAHETIGHFGLRTVLGSTYDKVLNDLYRDNEQVRAKANLQMENEGLDKLTAIEEVLADAIEEKIPANTLMGRAVQILRNLIRRAMQRIGMTTLNDARVQELLDSFSDYVVQGKGAKGPGQMNTRGVTYSGDTSAAGDNRFMPISGFYSALANAVEGVNMKSAPADGWKNVIKGLVSKGTVKQTEVEWTGLNDWLDLQQGKIDKAQVREFLNSNGVRVETEIRQGDDRMKILNIELANEGSGYSAEADGLINPEGFYVEGDGFNDVPPRVRAIMAYYDSIDYRDEDTGGTIYGDYTLPGGTNYREILLTLPTQEPYFSVSEFIDEMCDKYGFEAIYDTDGNYNSIKDEFPAMLSAEDQSRYKTLIEKQNSKFKPFESDHWSTPNVLAHFRVNERIDANGKRVLFVEEIQSDWAQAGREDGFATVESMRAKVAAQNKLDSMQDKVYALSDDMHEAFRAQNERKRQIIEKLGISETEIANFGGAIQYTLKHDPQYQALRNRSIAASNAYDTYKNETSKVKEAASSKGQPPAPFVTKTDAWLNLTLKRIITMAVSEGYDRVAFIDGAQSHLRFPMKKDGTSTEEAFKKFYDEMVPSTLNKLLSKLGGNKVERVNLVGGTVASVNHGALNNDLAQLGDTAFMAKYAHHAQAGFDITPAMVKATSAGLPLFRRGKNSPTPTAAGQQALNAVTSIGRQVAPTQQTALQKTRQAVTQAIENPTLTAQAAQKRYTNFMDKMGNAVFSPDYAINNAIRRSIASSSAPLKDLIGNLLGISQSQTVHAGAVAGTALEMGTVEYDPAMYKYKGVATKDKLITLIKKREAMAIKYGLTSEQAGLIAHTAMEAQRLAGLRTHNAKVQAEVDALNAKGRTKLAADRRKDIKQIHMDDAQIAAGLNLFNTMPDIKDLVDTWNGMRANSVKVLVKSGLWSQEYAEDMLAQVDYVPFFRDDQLEEKAGPKEFLHGLQVQAKEKQLKGSNMPVHDVFDNMARWTQYAIDRAVRNKSAISLVDAAVANGMATKVGEQDKNTARIWRDGVQEFYVMADPLYLDAFRGLEGVAIPVLKNLAWFSNFLRQSVVLNPLFSISQLPQDSFAAMFTSGLKPRYALSIPARAVKEFLKTLVGKSTMHEDLRKWSVVGVRDYSSAVARMDVEVLAGMRKQPGIMNRVKRGLEHFAMSSDNAVRQAVYEASIAQGVSPAEALEKAFEIINFKRRGNSKLLSMAGQTIPFFYAYLAAQNVAYKTITGIGISPSDRKAALGTLAATTGSVMAMSLIYAMMMGGDDDYNKKPATSRDRVLMIPGSGGISIPLRSDWFTIPKIFTEHLYLLMTDNGTEDGRKFRDSMGAAFANSLLSPTTVPQAIKPLVEVGLNYNFFQGRPLIGAHQKGLEKERQFTDTTSEIGKLLGSTGLVSPIAVDHLMKGMLGSVGGLVAYTSNMMLHSDPTVPRPDVSVRDALATFPGASTFVSREDETALKGDFYVLRESVSRAANTFNDMKSRSPQDIEEYLKQDGVITRIGLNRTVTHIEANLSKIRRQIAQITNMPGSQMDGAQKRETIKQLREMEENMLRAYNIKGLREMAGM